MDENQIPTPAQPLPETEGNSASTISIPVKVVAHEPTVSTTTQPVNDDYQDVVIAPASNDFSADTNTVDTISPDLDQDFVNVTPVINEPASPENAQIPPLAKPITNTEDINKDILELADFKPNTFVEKKTGNKLFVAIIVTLIVILLLSSALLVIINFFPNTLNSLGLVKTQEQVTVQQESPNTYIAPAIDTAKTGGDSTPATKSRKYNVDEAPADWNILRFKAVYPDAIDANGSCVNTTICGPNAVIAGGLTNVEKYNFGLDPLLEDTDNDGISDKDELYIYNTDPTKKDTDTDGVDDLAELTKCTDPINSNSAKILSNRQDSISKNLPLQKYTQNNLEKAGLVATESSQYGFAKSQCGN